MQKTISLSVIFPAHNEQGNIEKTILDSLKYLNDKFQDFEIIVVNDGSTDSTAQVVEQYANKHDNILLANHPVNRGYGQALKTGFDSASKQFIFFMDSDGQFDISEIDKFIEHINESNVLCGYRYNRADPVIRTINAILYHAYLTIVFGLKIKDVDCAFKIFPADAYKKISPIVSEGAFFSAEFLLKLKKAGYQFIEIPVTHYPRKHGTQSGANIKVILKMFVESYRMLMK